MRITTISIIAMLLAGTALAEGWGTSSGGSAAGGSGSATAAGAGASDGGDMGFGTRTTAGAADDPDARTVTGTSIDAGLLDADGIVATDPETGLLETDAVADTTVDETPLIDGDDAGLADGGADFGAAPVGADVEPGIEGEATMTEFGSTIVDTGEGEALLLAPDRPFAIAPVDALNEDKEPVDDILEGVGGDVEPETIEVD